MADHRVLSFERESNGAFFATAVAIAFAVATAVAIAVAVAAVDFTRAHVACVRWLQHVEA